MTAILKSTRCGTRTQPMKNCESVGDVVIAAKPKHETSRSVEDRLELFISRKLEKIAHKMSRDHPLILAKLC